MAKTVRPLTQEPFMHITSEPAILYFGTPVVLDGQPDRVDPDKWRR